MRRRYIFGGALVALLAVLCAACAAVRAGCVGELAGYDIAERWQGDGVVCTHVAAFIAPAAGLSEDAIYAARQSVDTALTQAALEPENENARLWADAYSGETAMTALADGAALNVLATATGGDFFLFHPVDMISGWHYSASDADDTLVVLDESAAWRLFGGTDIVGLSVELNGQPCTVAGVCAAPEGGAYGDTPRVYLALSYAARMGLEIAITSYEAVLPEVVSGFGTDAIQTALALGDKQVQLKTLTGRFTLRAGLRAAGELAYRAQRASAIEYPWWENRAIAIEGQNALWSVLVLGFGLSAAGSGGIGAAIICLKRKTCRRGNPARSRLGR